MIILVEFYFLIVQIFIIEFLSYRLNLNSTIRWFLIHFWFNMVIVYYSLNDLYTIIENPFEASSGTYSMIPIWLITLLHLYHMVAFPMRQEDWFHHLVMIGIICGIGIILPGWGPIQNLWSFTFCGLPGGLDYFILILYKMKQIKKSTQKILSENINIWLRSPLGIISSFLLLINPPQGIPIVFVYLVCALAYYNAQYYMKQAVHSNARLLYRNN